MDEKDDQQLLPNGRPGESFGFRLTENAFIVSWREIAADGTIVVWEEWQERESRFNIDRRRGEAAERLLDQIYSQRFQIESVDMTMQYNGIDRIFKHRSTGKRFTVQYKTSFDAHIRNSIFIETVSNSLTNREGWVYTCTADYLLYYIPGSGRLLVLKPRHLWEKLSEWAAQFPLQSVLNETYESLGIRVSFEELAKIPLGDFSWPELKVNDFSEFMEPPPKLETRWVRIEKPNA